MCSQAIPAPCPQRLETTKLTKKDKQAALIQQSTGAGFVLVLAYFT